MWQIISTYIGILMLSLVEIFFAKTVLNQKIKLKKIKLFYLLLLSTTIFTIITIGLEGILKTILLYIGHMFMFKNIFNLNYMKAIFLTFIYTIILIGIEMLELIIITKIMRVDKIVFYEKIAGSILGNITMCVLFWIITIIFKNKINKLLNTEISNNTRIIILSIITLVPTLLLFYTLVQKFKISDNIIQYLLTIIILIIVLFNLIRQTIENNRITSEYDKLLEFMTTYENEIENQRILRHEVKNEFRTIRAKICDKQENKEIIEYIDEIVKDKYEVNKEKYAKFGYLPPNGIKGLCYFKTQEAEKVNINVAVNISKKVKDSIIYKLNTKQQRDFGRILGVILDNAIEASSESTKKQLGIEAYINLESEFKLIISNTFNNKIEEIKIGKERFSTKGKNRGHGLLLVKQLVNRNTIFEVKTDIQGDIYIQTITVKKL